MAVIPLARARPPFRVTYHQVHGFTIQDADGSYIGEMDARREGPTCAEIAARLGFDEADVPSRAGAAKRRAGLSVGVSSYALVAAGAAMVAAIIWAGAPIPWWFALLPFALLCIMAGLLLLVTGGIAGLAGLGFWFARRRP